jgi:hypothetical protein
MKKQFRNSLLISLSATTILLSGCGENDSPEITVSDPPPEPPFQFTNADSEITVGLSDIVTPGVYAYQPVTANQGDGLFPSSGVALISNTGRIVFADENSSGFARVRATEGSLLATDFIYVTDAPDGESILGQPTVDIIDQDLRARPDPLTPAPEILSGTIENEAGELVESYQVTEGQANSSVTLVEIANTYRFSRPDNGTTTFQIDTDGSLTGSDSSGCSWSGTLGIPNPNSQLIEASLSASNCGSSTTATGPTRDGSYAALGHYDSVQEALSLYMLSDDYATRFVAQSDTYVSPPPPVEPAPFAFVSENNEIEPSVQSRLTPGFFDVQVEQLGTGGSFDAPVSAEAYLSATGRIFVDHPEFHAFARISVNNTNNFAVPMAVAPKPNTSYDQVDETLRGIPDIQGNIEDSGGDLLYRYSMTPSPEAGGTAVNLIDVAGMYSQTSGNGITTNFVITDAGELSGSDTTGCSFDGDLFLPDPSGNALSIIEVDFTASGCGATPNLSSGDRDGDYNGVGYYQPDLETLTFGLVNQNVTGLFVSE